MQAIPSPVSPARPAWDAASAPARSGNGPAGAPAFADLLRAAAGDADGGVSGAAPSATERAQPAPGTPVTDGGDDPAASAPAADAAARADTQPSTACAAAAAPAERGHGGRFARPNVLASRAATGQRAESPSARPADAASKASDKAAGQGGDDKTATPAGVAVSAEAPKPLPPVTPVAPDAIGAGAAAAPAEPPEPDPAAAPHAARGAARGGLAALSSRGGNPAAAAMHARASADAPAGPAADAAQAAQSASHAETPGLHAAPIPTPPAPVDAVTAAGAGPVAATPPADTLVASMTAVPTGSALATSNAENAAGTPPPAPVWQESQVGAALGSSAFAPALGTTLAVLARDGVQQARLHLNPAELGPVAVRITLDGNSAQVDFHAAAAATRAALEAALPALAVAMHETGLTLTGGGVHDQSSQARDPSAPAWNARAGGGAGDDRADDPLSANPPPVRVHRGLVDLVA